MKTAAVCLLLSILAIGTARAADPVNPVRTHYVACPTDEGDGNRDCVWDSRHFGNGLGHSFYVGTGGKVYVLPHHITHHLLFHKESS